MGWQTPERWLWRLVAAPVSPFGVSEPVRIALAYEGILAELRRLPWEWPS